MTFAVRQIEPAPYETVSGWAHVYTEDDCHSGFLNDDVFTGEVGKYLWQATVRLHVPYCLGCDEELPGDGVCHGCRLIHEDVGQLTECKSDPFGGSL